MTDIEKVIKGLEVHTGVYTVCKGCPYQEQGRCQYLLMEDALNLLKEQEAEIERLEHDLAVTQDNLNYYVNGNA